ncbi:hypothetical protein [Massilia sp. LjRoot122]|uniref:hypothetical protein n=1 Tax=Massilia sp. LjRoot122 TaxID=3342257 RepID=UPI003ED0C243
MEILMWLGLVVAAIFGGLGIRGGVTSNDEGAAKCYRVAAAGAVLACGALSYQYLGTIPH